MSRIVLFFPSFPSTTSSYPRPRKIFSSAPPHNPARAPLCRHPPPRDPASVLLHRPMTLPAPRSPSISVVVGATAGASASSHPPLARDAAGTKAQFLVEVPHQGGLLQLPTRSRRACEADDPHTSSPASEMDWDLHPRCAVREGGLGCWFRSIRGVVCFGLRLMWRIWESCSRSCRGRCG